MGLRDDIQSDIAEAFDDDLADAVQTFTATHKEDGDYDPVTGEFTGETVSYSGRGVFDEYAQDRIDNINIRYTDTLLIVLANEIDRKPEEGDMINGLRVMRVEADPALAHYEIQLRGV